MIRKLFLCFLLSPFSLAWGQGVFAPSQIAFKVVNGYTSPIANATITVCAANAAGIPCSPALTNTIFKDAALTQPLSNPFTADAFGNYQFAAASGTYTVTVTAFGFAGNSYQVTLGGSGGGTFTIPDPLNAVDLNVSGNTNLNGFTSTGQTIYISPTLPFIGLAPDYYCAYGMPPQTLPALPLFQIGAFLDPNNGGDYLCVNDGVGLPNLFQLIVPFNTPGSFQPQNSFGVWNLANGGFDWAQFPVSAALLGTNPNGLPVAAVLPLSAAMLGSNTAGLPIASQLFVTNAKTAAYPVIASDFLYCKTIPVASGTFAITLLASAPPAGQCLNIINYGTGVVTVSPNGLNLNGSVSSLTIPAGSASAPNSLWAVSDGANYEALITLSQAAGTGTVSANNGTAGALARYAAAGGSTTVSASSNIIDDGTHVVLPLGSTSNASFQGSGMAANTGFYFPTTSTWAFLISGTVQLYGSNTKISEPNGGIFAWSQSAQANGASDTGISRTAAAVIAFGAGGAADETALLRWNTCKLTNDVSLNVNTATTVCQWTLPATAKIWAWQCQLPWAVSAGTGTNTISLGVNVGQSPATAFAAAEIKTTNTNTATEVASVTFGSGATNILTSPTLTPVATTFQSSTSGGFTGSATAGTFSITMTAAGTTVTANAKAGGSCLLY